MKYLPSIVLMTLAAAIFAFVLLIEDSKADGIVDLDEVSIDYKNYKMMNDKARNLLIYPEHPKEGINLEIKSDILSYFFWDNKVESLTTDSQYASVGLDTRAGTRLTKHIELGLWHHSQHLLDRPHAFMERYPSEDAVELKVYLFKAKPRGESLF